MTLASRPLCEINGLILLWHHAKAAPPQWEIPEAPEYGSEEWTPYDPLGRGHSGTVRSTRSIGRRVGRPSRLAVRIETAV